MKKKLAWLEAYRETLQQYITGTHYTAFTLCPKCTLGLSKSRFTDKLLTCGLCPESVFNAPHKKTTGCLHRTFSAFDSRDIKMLPKNNQRLHGVIEYHERAIEFLENMERFNLNTLKQGLKKIDLTLKEKYKL